MYRDTRIFGNVDDTAGTLQGSETDTDKNRHKQESRMIPHNRKQKNTDTQIKEKKIIRVGSFEDTFDYVDANGMRRGYGYELMQALAGYTGWKIEHVQCDWSNV